MTDREALRAAYTKISALGFLHDFLEEEEIEAAIKEAVNKKEQKG